MSFEENTLSKVFYNRVHSLADKDFLYVYLEGKWQWLTWKRYGKMVEQVFLGLKSLGIEKGDACAVLSATRLEWGLSDLANLSAGAVTITIYPTLLADGVKYIASHADVRLIYAENMLQVEKILSVKQDLPKLEKIIVYEGYEGGRDDVISWTDLLEIGRKDLERHPDLWKESIAETGPHDPATIVYTSGTTGPPKGVILDHDNFVWTCRSLETLALVTPEDMAISYLPLAHIYEKIASFAYGMYIGGKGGIARSFDTLAEDIQLMRPNCMAGVPRVYEKIYSGIHNRILSESPGKQKIFNWAVSVGREASAYRLKGEKPPLGLSMKLALADKLVFDKVKQRLGGRMGFMVSAAAPISTEILEFFYSLGLLVVEGYGMTECTGPASLNPKEDIRFGTVGKAIPGSEIRIAEDGEILVKGGNVFRGYFKNPQDTAETLVDGWLHTGDIGELDADGYLTITDRKKDLIITAGGKNIAPQNIENHIKTDLYISEIVVFGDRMKYLTALVTLDEEAVAGFAKDKGIEYKDFADLAARPEIHTLVNERLEAKNQGLARFETIKKFRVLPKQFTIEDGEITPTMKIKRKEVSGKYRELLDSMYDED